MQAAVDISAKVKEFIAMPRNYFSLLPLLLSTTTDTGSLAGKDSSMPWSIDFSLGVWVTGFFASSGLAWCSAVGKAKGALASFEGAGLLLITEE